MIQKKKFVKTFRNTKTVQLILLLLLETAYVLVLTLNPALGTKLFEDRTLFILCTLSWILALFNLIWLLYDFYKLRTFAEESHALNRAAFLDHLTGIPNRHGLDVVFETYDSPESLAHVACYMVTITNLKEINQTMGHVVGDQMLKDFSGILESVGDAFGVVGRNGGNHLSHYAESQILLSYKKILPVRSFGIRSSATYSFYPLHNSAEFYLYPAIAFHQKQKCPQHIHHLTL